MDFPKYGLFRPSSKKPVQETFEQPSRYGMEITRSSDLYTAIAASAREESSPSLSRRQRRGGIFPQRESSPPTPTRRRYRSSVYSQNERQRDPTSAISLPTASSLYSRLTNGAQSPASSARDEEEPVNNERAIRAAQEALFGNYDLRVATRKGGLRGMKTKTLEFFALLRDRIIFFGRRCLFLPGRPLRVQPIDGRRVVRVNEEGVSPWATDVTLPGAAYEVLVREVAEASADAENPPPYNDAPQPYVSVFADVLENFPLTGPWATYGG